MQLLNQMVIPCLGFEALFSTVTTPFYFPTSSVPGYEFLYILSNTFFSFVLGYSYSSGCEVVSHCGLHFFLMINDVEHLFKHYGKDA